MHGEKHNVAPANPLVSQGQEPLSEPRAVIGEKQNGYNQPLVSNEGVRGSVERKARPALSSEPQDCEHEVRNASKSKPKNKSKACSWGLIWRTKKNDDGTAFRSKNVLLKRSSNLSDVECDICRNLYNPDLMYIFCETCTKWYHADAVELEESKLFNLIGFKCCKCRRIKSPLCPYTSPKRKMEVEVKKPNKRTPKQARQGTDYFPETISEQLTQGETAAHVLPWKKELVCTTGDNPLSFSLSKVDHGTQNTSGVALEQNPTLSGLVITCKSCHQIEATMHGEKHNVAPTNPLVSQGQKPLNAPRAVIGEKQNGYNQQLVSKEGERRSVERKARPALSSEPQDCEHEVRSASNSEPKNKSKACSWGLIWTKKNDDGTAFRSKNVLLKRSSNLSDVECDICRNPYNPDLMYIFCEWCTKWYHADAVELEESKLFNLIGFKCCKCRKIKSPLCPYTSPKRKLEVEVKKPNKRTPKQARQGTDYFPETISEQLTQGETAAHVLPWKKELVCTTGDNPLSFSLSKVDHGTQNTSGVALEQNPNLSGSAPQKPPVGGI